MVYPVVPTLFARKCTRHFTQILISRITGPVVSASGRVRPLPNDCLQGFQADFSFLLGVGFADLDHAAAHEG